MITREYRDKSSGIGYSFAPTLQQNSEGAPYYQTEPLSIEYKGKKHPCVKYLGNGAHCKAGLFGQALGPNFVVKSPLGEKTENHHIDNCKTDLQFLKEVYPVESAPYLLHDFKYLNPYTNKETTAFFALLPYFPGESLHLALQKATSEEAVSKICLAVVLELQRIHDLGILHGDIRTENILVHQNPETDAIEIHFIDFEWAYRITDEFARKTSVAQKDATYFPKERTASHPGTPAPTFEQDIFSLGWWLNYCLEAYAKNHYDPSVKAYCDLALNDNPHKRPSLLLFSEILKERIAAATKPLSTPSLSTTARLMQNGIGSTSPDSINYDSDFVNYDSNDGSLSTSPQPAAKASSTQTLVRVRRSFNLVALASSKTPRAPLTRTDRSLNLAAMVSPTRG